MSMRTCTEDSLLGGHQIRAGQKVVIWNASVNRDEEVFLNPNLLDLARTPNHHLAFGYGEHFCLGAHLARLELRVFLEELMARSLDFELTGADRAQRFELRRRYQANAGCCRNSNMNALFATRTGGLPPADSWAKR